MKGELTPETSIYVAGHRGLVGSAIVRRLEQEGFRNVLTVRRDESGTTAEQLDRIIGVDDPDALIPRDLVG